ncbi:MAG TPA: metalloregulator ArsR/SmtB family transcription factor [Pyrinomonadaceae bacterium]|nr:metalloregulator ArsR/SmtB family transcription factor [Pyrinomonadaceae bacterium]
MSAKTQPPGERKTRRAIAKLLKTEGPIDSAQLAERLGLTAMAVRQHLYALQREGLVTHEERPVPIGRPAKFWHLTREADHLFPEAYAELSVALINSVKDAFGDEGLERVLTSRCARQKSDYTKRIRPGDSLAKKLQELAKVRTEEGYMAEIRRDDDGGYLLVENHCPICAAANACQGFCSTELELFRSVLGPGVDIERAEHIIRGDQRCVYRVKEVFPQRRKGAKEILV